MLLETIYHYGVVIIMVLMLNHMPNIVTIFHSMIGIKNNHFHLKKLQMFAI